MDTVSPPTPAATSRGFVADGPPFLAVALVFVALLAVRQGAGDPASGLALLALGLLAALALELRAWARATRADRRAAEATLAALPARLARARAARIERGRWR